MALEFGTTLEIWAYGWELLAPNRSNFLGIYPKHPLFRTFRALLKDSGRAWGLDLGFGVVRVGNIANCKGLELNMSL